MVRFIPSPPPHLLDVLLNIHGDDAVHSGSGNDSNKSKLPTDPRLRQNEAKSEHEEEGEVTEQQIPREQPSSKKVKREGRVP